MVKITTQHKKGNDPSLGASGASSTLISTTTINGVDEGLAQGDGLRRFFDVGRLNVLAHFDQGFTFLVSITAP